MSTIPKTKSRRIVVGGKAFRWLVGSGQGRLIGNSGAGLTVTVQADNVNPGRVLQAELYSKTWTRMNDYDQEHGIHKVSLTPKDVEQLIDRAIRSGWDPDAKGSKFVLKGPLSLQEYEL